MVLKGELTDYAQSMDSLREFVALIGPFLANHEDGVLKAHLPLFAPFLLAQKKSNPDSISEDAFPTAVLEELSEGRLTIEHQEGGQDKITIKAPNQTEFTRALKELSRAKKPSALLYNSALISLVSTAESFVSRILHVYYSKCPGVLSGKDKVFSLDELETFSTMDDARQYVIDSRIEGLLRDSFEDWVKYLREKVGLKMGYLDSHMSTLVEVFQRRNVLVHNGGRVNSIYLSKVATAMTKGLSSGDVLPVTPEYLDKAIDLFEMNFILIAAELWKKFEPTGHTRPGIMIDRAFEHLCAGRWQVAEGLSIFTMNEGQVPEELSLKGQLNYWQSVKWQGRYDEIRAEVEKADFSAKDLLFTLAWLALADKKDTFFKALPEAIKTYQLYEQVHTWPIFRGMRAEPEYQAFCEAHGAEFEAAIGTLEIPVNIPARN